MNNGSKDDPLATGGGLSLFHNVAAHADEKFIGRELGDYRICGLIAHGGMSRVYRAQRIDGSFEREVAIKVSAISGFDERMRGHFLIEQGVLAGLNHPNISQLYDAHVTDEGWPYIVMELVDGEAMVQFVEHSGLPIESRARLLIDVIDAIAYAHARLVVHRDIKPGNVMVNAEGRPKLLDFGIAKLLETDATVMTQAGPMTPRYASPEQLLGQSITVASDIYQLGLLMFEVLTGKPPNDDESLTEAIQRAASGRPIALDSAAMQTLPRELQLIVEQCLRASPTERYTDANALRNDLLAWLTGFPVTAVGQSTGYRFRKLLARHKPATITAALALMALVGGTSWYTWQLSVARAHAEQQAAAATLEAEKSKQVSQFMVDLMEAANPVHAKGADVTVKDMLDKGVGKVRNELEGQEELQAELLYTMAHAYNNLDEFDVAGELIDETVGLYRSLASDDPVPLATALYEQSRFYRHRGDRQRALEIQEEALRLVENLEDDKAVELHAAALNSLGILASEMNDFEMAERYYKDGIELRNNHHGEGHLETSTAVANYARLLTKLGRHEEALPMLEFAYRVAEDELGPYHDWIAPRAINLGRTYQAMGRLDEAERLLRRALEVDRHMYGNEHHFVASSLQNLSHLLREIGQLDEATRLLEQALKIEVTSLGERHVDTGQTRYALANRYTDLGRFEEAGLMLDDAESVLLESLTGDHIYLAELAHARGRLLMARTQPERALGRFNDSIAIFERLFDSESERLVEPLFDKAMALRAAGRNVEAANAYGRGVELLADQSRQPAKLIDRLQTYAELLAAADRGQESRAALERATRLAADAG